MQIDTSATQTLVMAPEGLDCLVTLVEHVCTLPAVATLDWCDRAAVAFAATTPGATAVVMLAMTNADGTLRAIESIGVAKHGAGEAELGDLRARGERLTTLGLDLSAERTGHVIAGTVSRIYGEHVAPVMGLLDGISPNDAVIGVNALGEPGNGRCVCVIIGAAGGVSEWLSGVVASILPSLSRKILVAIGASSTARSSWISPREQLVLEQLILGKSVKQIADDLGRSPHTVHDHVKALHRKLNASSRGELVARALGHLIEGTRIRHGGHGGGSHEDSRKAA